MGCTKNLLFWDKFRFLAINYRIQSFKMISWRITQILIRLMMRNDCNQIHWDKVAFVNSFHVTHNDPSHQYSKLRLESGKKEWLILSRLSLSKIILELNLKCRNMMVPSGLYNQCVSLQNSQLFFIGMQDQYYTFTMFQLQGIIII